MTERVQTGHMASMMTAFGIKHSVRSLADILETVERNELSHRELLEMVLQTEADGRFARKRARNYAAAHFPPSVRPTEKFEPTALDRGIDATQVEQFKGLSWLDTRDSGQDRLHLGHQSAGQPLLQLRVRLLWAIFYDLYQQQGDCAVEELMGDQTLTTAMLDRILNHTRYFSLRGESYRLKHPELYAVE